MQHQVWAQSGTVPLTILYKSLKLTLTNKVPERWWLGNYMRLLSFWDGLFSGTMLSFRVGRSPLFAAIS